MGHENLASAGLGHNPRADVHGHTAYAAVITQLNLASMHACTDVNSKRLQRIP